MTLRIERFAIDGPLAIVTPRFGDARGFFAETYNARDFAAAGITCTFVQDNQSRSTERGTVRGLHFQIPPHAQAKLVRVAHGRILDVIVDLRKNSSTYGRHEAIELSAENGTQMFVPAGFAHGFCTLEPDTEVLYKTSDYYTPTAERGLLWNDPALGIGWPPFAGTNISAKDLAYPPLTAIQSPFGP
jgi:dTDP-4-dehydrorhamnose 3,5-epimerase